VLRRLPNLCDDEHPHGCDRSRGRAHRRGRPVRQAHSSALEPELALVGGWGCLSRDSLTRVLIKSQKWGAVQALGPAAKDAQGVDEPGFSPNLFRTAGHETPLVVGPARLAARSRGVVHWLRDQHTFRNREDPDETWRCCPYWQRTLIQKWNSREFASKHGCRVPELYWSGGPFARAPLESLPDHFVVRPVRGAGHRGVLVVSVGRELLRQESATDSELRRRLSRLRRLRHPATILTEWELFPDRMHVGRLTQGRFGIVPRAWRRCCAKLPCWAPCCRPA
jgi:hypothetical protein